MLSDISALLAGIQVKEWDLLLMGDGSGSGHACPGGWACFPVANDKGNHVFLDPVFGAVSHGSINLMEVMPYWHFLHQHYYYMGGAETCLEKKIQVHVITDSQWAATAMSGRGKITVNRDMMALFAIFRDWGYQIHWHHVSRETIELQSMADRLAAQVRDYVKAVEHPPEFDEKYRT